VPQAPTSPQSVKHAGSTELVAPGTPKPPAAPATAARTKAASVPSVGTKKTAPARTAGSAPKGKGRRSR
jgi:hypothetical protein